MNPLKFVFDIILLFSFIKCKSDFTFSKTFFENLRTQLINIISDTERELAKEGFTAFQCDNECIKELRDYIKEYFYNDTQKQSKKRNATLDNMILYSSRKKNDVSSYYSCKREMKEQNYSYYTLVVNPQGKRSDVSDKEAFTQLEEDYENFRYVWGFCLPTMNNNNWLRIFLNITNTKNNNLLGLNNTLFYTLKLSKEKNEIDNWKLIIVISSILLFIIVIQVIFVLFNTLPECIFRRCFTYKKKPDEIMEGKEIMQNDIIITSGGLISDVKIDKTKLNNFVRCFNLTENSQNFFSNKNDINKATRINNDNGLIYIKGLRGLSLFFTLFGLVFIQLMNYLFKLYEQEKYVSLMRSFLFSVINGCARYSPRVLFSCSGYICIYKFLCFIDENLCFYNEEDEKGRRVSELIDITKINFNKVFEIEKKDASLLSFKVLLKFISYQIYRFIIMILAILFVRYSLFFLLNLTVSGPSLLTYNLQQIDNFSILDILGHIFFIGNFNLFEMFDGYVNVYKKVSKQNLEQIGVCIMQLFWPVLNEAFFFIVTLPIIFFSYKKKKCFTLILLCLFLFFFIFKVVLFAISRTTKNSYSTLYFYTDNMFGIFHMSVLYNYSFYLIGAVFGVLNYIILKNPSDSLTFFDFPKNICEIIKYQNNLILYITAGIIFVFFCFLLLFQPIMLLFFDSFSEYLSNPIINFVYIFDEDIIILLIQYMFFSFFVKGEKYIMPFLSSERWTFTSKIHYPFLLYVNVVLVFVFYKSETRITVELLSVFFYGIVCGLILFVVIWLNCIMFEFPWKRLTWFMLNPKKRERGSIDSIEKKAY